VTPISPVCTLIGVTVYHGVAGPGALGLLPNCSNPERWGLPLGGVEDCRRLEVWETWRYGLENWKAAISAIPAPCREGVFRRGPVLAAVKEGRPVT